MNRDTIKALLVMMGFWSVSLPSYAAERTIHFSGHIANYRMYENVTQNVVDNNVACSVSVSNTGPSNSRQCLSIEMLFLDNGKTSLVQSSANQIDVYEYPPGSITGTPTGSCKSGEVTLEPGGVVQFQYRMDYESPLLKTALCAGRLSARDADPNVPGSVVASGAIANIQEEKVLGGVLSGAFYFSGGAVDTSSASGHDDLNTSIESTLGNDFQSSNMNVYCERACQATFSGDLEKRYLYNLRGAAYRIYRLYADGSGESQIQCSGEKKDSTKDNYPSPNFCRPNMLLLNSPQDASSRPILTTPWGKFTRTFANHFYGAFLERYPQPTASPVTTPPTGDTIYPSPIVILGYGGVDIGAIWMSDKAAREELQEIFSEAVRRSASSFESFYSSHSASLNTHYTVDSSIPARLYNEFANMLITKGSNDFAISLSESFGEASRYGLYSTTNNSTYGINPSFLKKETSGVENRDRFCKISCGGSSNDSNLGYSSLLHTVNTENKVTDVPFDSPQRFTSLDSAASSVAAYFYDENGYTSHSVGKDELLHTASPNYGGGIVKEMVLGAGYEICNANQSSQARKAWPNPTEGSPSQQKALYCSQRDSTHEDLYSGSADSHSFTINGGNAF